MVVNLCLPHFKTAIQCNKLCADGYDVTNLLSTDPAARKRGFKIEYFLRPPVQVTLQFDFHVDVCRVDVELWPWGMDRGQACKKLEISTSSDPLVSLRARPNQHPCSKPRQGSQPDQTQGQSSAQRWPLQGPEQHLEQNERKIISRGHQWSMQAKHWDYRDLEKDQHWKPKHQKVQADSQLEPEFRLVGRCELRDDTVVYFSHPCFHSRPPFDSPPRPPTGGCRREELWSRGPLSLGSVTHLRVTVPYGGAASAQGLKSLAVWGQPARCCSHEEVERVRTLHKASLRPPQQPSLFGPPISRSSQPPTTGAATLPSSTPVPEEFLDPLTQEVMSLPMLLPSGTSVDNSTLEEFQKRESSWGRAPNDPFTGVPFTADSQPCPNPLLKSRIDHFLLQTGAELRRGMLGRRGDWENPHPSRLLPPRGNGECPPSTSTHQHAPCESNGTSQPTSWCEVVAGDLKFKQKQLTLANEDGVGNGTEDRNKRLNSQLEREQGSNTSLQGSSLGKENSIELCPGLMRPDEASSARHSELPPESKRQRVDAKNTGPSSSSHEQRLSASLDEALLSALRGRPSYTSHSSQPSAATDTAEASAGLNKCGVCSGSLSAYSTFTPAYRLPCGHFLCRPCLHIKTRPLNSLPATPLKHILCPLCQVLAPYSDITRVHH